MVAVKNKVALIFLDTICCLLFLITFSCNFLTLTLLISFSVHDGWGIAATPGQEGDAIEAGTTTNMDTIGREHSFRKISAHGLSVGLSDGLMGNSEVGHLNIGAGRVVWQDIVRIDVSIKKREFHKNKTILESFERAKAGNGRLHLLGLISDGGVHSHINHLFALLETAKEVGVPKTYVHFFGDGRDTAPRSSIIYAKQLQEFLEKEQYGELADITGRYYAMDRDKRWERIKIAIDGLVKGEGESVQPTGALDAIQANYDKDVTDEFLKPIIINKEGRIQEGDTLFFFNYRSDRMREITSVIGLPDKPVEVDIPADLHITTMSRYNSEFPFPVAFPPQGMTNVLAEWLATQGVKQAHVAETEKYAHVTFFFNGGVEKQFENEERHMIPSPKVPTYDQQPEIQMAELIKAGEHEFIMCNFAPPDMVGHTGVYDAADAAVGTSKWINHETGAPHTAHTTNKVPFIITGDPKTLSFSEDKEGQDEGALCDVAATILEIMGLPKPEGAHLFTIIVKYVIQIIRQR
ncbi:PGM protein [Flagelloscypha sp. PMI_526]|nr:PGM protein [Flagelloscypha sp. PMI_526]